MRVTEDDELDQWVRCGYAFRGVAKSSSAVARAVRPARIRAVCREARGDIGMQPAEGANRQPVTQHVAQRAIASVLAWPKPVPVLNPRPPACDFSDPRTERVVDSHVMAKDVAAPTVVISGDHSHRDASLDDIGERSEGAKPAAGNDSAPLKPELEQVAVDDERSGVPGDVPEESYDVVLDIVVRKAEVRVRDEIAGRVEPRRGEHARILPSSRSLYKRLQPDDLRGVTNDDSAAASAHVRERVHHDVEFRVRYAETDQMGVVYHTNYLVWCEVGRTDFIRARGMSYADIERAGVGLAVSEVSARFHAAARYDEMIRVRTTLVDVRSRAITFDYLITSVERGTRLVTARTALVCVDPSGRPIALPADIRFLFDR